MIAFLFANWKSVLACIATFGLCLMLHKLDVHRIEAKHAAEIVNVKKAMTEECTKAQAITEKVSHDYQNKIARLNSRLAAAHRLHDSACTSVTGIPASRHDDAAKLGKPSGSSAQGAGYGERTKDLSARYLIDLTGEGEKYRLQLLACQQFVTMTTRQGKAGR